MYSFFFLFFFSLIRPPPGSTLFPYTTLFRSGVEVLARLGDGTVVAARQGRLLATSFHPELTRDERFHRYFLSLGKRSEEHTSELQSLRHLVCRLLLEKKKKKQTKEHKNEKIR